MICMGFAGTGWSPTLYGPALLLVPTVFPAGGLPCPSETHCTIPTSALVFEGNIFTHPTYCHTHTHTHTHTPIHPTDAGPESVDSALSLTCRLPSIPSAGATATAEKMKITYSLTTGVFWTKLSKTHSAKLPSTVTAPPLVSAFD